MWLTNLRWLKIRLKQLIRMVTTYTFTRKSNISCLPIPPHWSQFGTPIQKVKKFSNTANYHQHSYSNHMSSKSLQRKSPPWPCQKATYAFLHRMFFKSLFSLKWFSPWKTKSAFSWQTLTRQSLQSLLSTLENSNSPKKSLSMISSVIQLKQNAR